MVNPVSSNNVVSTITNLPIPSNPIEIMSYAEMLLVQDYDDQLKEMANNIKQNTQLKKAYREYKQKLNDIKKNPKNDKGEITLTPADEKIINHEPDFVFDPTMNGGIGGIKNLNEEADLTNPNVNLTYQQVNYNGKIVAKNETAKWWGDPHFIDPDGKGNRKQDFDFQGKAGVTYNYFTDSNVKLEATHASYQGDKTVVGSVKFTSVGPNAKSEVIFDAKKAPTLDGKDLPKNQWKSLADGGRVLFDGTTLNINTKEGHNFFITDKGEYLDGKINTGAKGVLSDGVASTGVMGQLFDADNNLKFKNNEESESTNADFEVGKVNAGKKEVAGKIKSEDLDIYITSIQTKLDSLNSETELAQTELSTLTSQRKLAFESVSSIISKMFDGAGSIVRNIR